MSSQPSPAANGMSIPPPRLEVRDDGPVRCLVLDHARTRNALAPELSRQIIQGVLTAADEGLGAIVITGAHGGFCSGGDVRALHAQQALPPASQSQRLSVLNELIRTLRQCPLPVVAAVEGTAAGAGFSLMLACDLAVAAEDARFVMAYVHLGLSPDGGGSFHLARALPAPKAFAAMALGEAIDAQTLQRVGLLHSLTPCGQALDAAMALAQRLAAGPRQAIAGVKQLVRQAALDGLEPQLENERELFVKALHARAAREAIPAFLERGRRPAGPP